MKDNGVSVIVCCYNSSSVIEPTLQHIAAQIFDDNIVCEVILVDNASTDDIQEKAKDIWTKTNCPNIKLTIVHEPKPGLAHARQKGINEANYEYFVFCDDDNWLDKNYLNNVFRLFKANTTVAILGGNGTAHFEDEHLKPEWFDKFHQSYATGALAEDESIVNSVYGAGMAVRKSVLMRVMSEHPMFLHGRKQNQLTSGEDTEICLRVRLAGYNILYSPELTFKHFLLNKRLTWAYLKKLHVGLAKSHIVINLYERALSAQRSTLPSFYWLKKATYYWGIYLKYWPKHFSVYKNREGTIEEIHHIMWKSIASDYIAYNFKTISIYRHIISLKNDLKGIYK